MPVALVAIGLAVTAALLAGVLHQEPPKPKNATRVKAKFIETKLPDSRVLDAIWYTTDVKVTDDDFKELSSKSVERLNLTDQQITGSGLQYLKPELID